MSMEALATASDHFIPVSRFGLKDHLLAMLREKGEEIRAWGRALDCLSAWRHQEYRTRLLALLEDYLPFSPDSDTASLIDFDAAAKIRARGEFIAGIEELLVQANYVRLSEHDLQRILVERSPHGLNLAVDLSDFDEMVLYYRGTDTLIAEERSPWRLYLRSERFEIPLFQRLFLMLKLKDLDVQIAEVMTAKSMPRAKAERLVRHRHKHLPVGVSSDYLYLKIFKRIPQADLEMLFPNTRITFRPFDKLKLFVTAGGGTAAGIAGTATKILAATNPITLGLALLTLSGVVFRQVMGFFNTRTRYMMVLAQSLYFFSLANNRGALTLLADSAEEEDVKEDMLLYVFLAQNPTPRTALGDAKGTIGQFLSSRCAATVSFDIEDTLGRLLRDGLIAEDESGMLRALLPEQAQSFLDERWGRLLDVDTLDQAAAAHGGA